MFNVSKGLGITVVATYTLYHYGVESKYL